MKRSLLLTAALQFLFIFAHGQSILSGLVKDSNGKEISYVNIGIKNSRTGTVSAIDGKFSIAIPDSLLRDSLTFSSVGFNEKSFLISQLMSNKNLTVTLNEKVTTLAEVKISNIKRKQYKLGITGRTPMLSIPSRSYQKTDIIEQARLIHLKKPSKLINANIFVLSESMKEVNIRLNFYAIENGMPGKRLVEKTIIKKANLQKGWFTIDLQDEDIYLDQDFVVAFEYLPSEQSAISFAAKLGAADSFLRSNSQGIWRKNSVGGCSIYVTAEQ